MLYLHAWAHVSLVGRCTLNGTMGRWGYCKRILGKHSLCLSPASATSLGHNHQVFFFTPCYHSSLLFTVVQTQLPLGSVAKKVVTCELCKRFDPMSKLLV